jgi:hypothetical protein
MKKIIFPFLDLKYKETIINKYIIKAKIMVISISYEVK